MDINSLLSPQDTPTGETPPPLAPTSSPQRSPNTLQRPGRPSKRSSSNLSHQLHPSPHTPTEQLLTPTLSHNGSYTLPHLPMPSPGITSAPNGRGQQSATSTPSSDRASQPPLLRAPSTPGMDTLAGKDHFWSFHDICRTSNRTLTWPTRSCINAASAAGFPSYALQQTAQHACQVS